MGVVVVVSAISKNQQLNLHTLYKRVNVIFVRMDGNQVLNFAIFRPYGRKFKHIYMLFAVRMDGN